MSNREKSFLTMLESTAIIQRHVSVILQAKALEALKSKRWICYHIADSRFFDKADQLKQAIEIHEKVVAVIDGLSKLENGLARNLKVVLNHTGDESSDFGGFGGGNGLGDLFQQDGDDV